jgi:streptomycin 6-kinase
VTVPGTLAVLEQRWSLTVLPPFEGGTCSWVAPVIRANGAPAVLKLGMPHYEAMHEIDGLRFWGGEPTVRLLEADEELNAMLLERCEPGTSLGALTESEQDVVIAELLRRLWRTPPAGHAFRPLSAMIAHWTAETVADADQWRDAALVREGLALFAGLSAFASSHVLLATDLHAANVLRAERKPWLVIDPKPFVGDPAYDVTQHLLNCRTRLLRSPHDTIHRLADAVAVDPERVRLWTFARAAAEPREDWTDDSLPSLARTLAP